MGNVLNAEAFRVLEEAQMARAARVVEDARNNMVHTILDSVPFGEDVAEDARGAFRQRFEAFLRAVFESGITEKNGWLRLPQVKTLAHAESFGDSSLTPDTSALVFAFKGFGPQNAKRIFSRVGFLSDERGTQAREALKDLTGAPHFSGWRAPEDVGEVLRPVLIALKHGRLNAAPNDVFAHFQDPQFSDFDGGVIRGGRSEWVAPDRVVGVSKVKAFREGAPEVIAPFFSQLRYKDNRGDVVVIKNPPLE